MIISAIVAIAFGRLPIQLIVLAQAVTIFIVPFIGIAMILIANDKKIMGKDRDKEFVKIVGILEVLILFFLAIKNVYVLFIK